MRTSAAVPSPAAEASTESAALRTALADFKELLKPGITTFVVVMAAAGYVLAADGPIDWLRLLGLMLGTALSAGGGAALNHAIERDHDARMVRTAARPVPAGRVGATVAAVYGVVCAALGAVVLTETTNPLTTGLAVLTVVLYVAVYTPLKRVSVWNTLVGAIPGALPALGGAAAASGRADATGWALFAVLFLWQLPHFFALAWMYRDDYRQAGYRMLPTGPRRRAHAGLDRARRDAPPARRRRRPGRAREGGSALPCRHGRSGRRVHAPRLLVFRPARRHARTPPAARLDRLRAGLLRARRRGLPAPMKPDALTVRDLAHTYRGTTVPALAGVSLTVAPGERVALLGPNGSGKTTLFRVVTALLQPDAGTVTVAGADTRTQADAVRRHLGIVFQSVALDGVLTVAENLRVAAALSGVPRAETAARVADALREVGLVDRANERVATLSGGLARRADLARVLLHRPALLLLDEPTVGLDPTARREVWDALDALRASGTAQLVATHLLDEAEACDRVVVLDRGRVVADGTPADLMASLGRDALWLDAADDAAALAARLGATGLDARAVGRRVLVVSADPAALLATLYGTPGVGGATVRRPTLDDVFAARTGGRPRPRPLVTHAIAALWRREIRIFVRDRARVVGALVQPLAIWALLGVGFGAAFRLPGRQGPDYLSFLFPGIVALVVLFTAIFSTISVVEDRQTGVLHAALVAPQRRVALVLGVLSGGVTLAVAQAALVMLLAPLAGLHPTVAGAGVALLACTLTAVALTALGFVMAWRLDTTRGFHAVMNLVLMPLWILSGGFFPVDGAPAVMRGLMLANPVTYGVAAIRLGLGATAGAPVGTGVALAVLAASAAGLVAWAVQTVGRPVYR